MPNTSAFAVFQGPGLTVFVSQGKIYFGGIATTIAQSIITCSANSTTSIYIDLQSNSVLSGTSGFPLGSIPLATVVTDPTNVTSVTDNRPDFDFSGLPLIGFSTLSSSTTGVVPFTPNSYVQILGLARVTFYSAGDIISLRFGNGTTTIDTGNNYNYRWLTAAAGGTTFAAGVDSTADGDNSRIKMAAQTTTISREIEFTLTNTSNKTKVMNIRATTETAGTSTLPSIDLGSAQWFNTAGPIGCFQCLTAGGNNFGGSIAFYGSK